MHSLIRLRHIVAVARSGSFSIAAEEVGISQPALSRSIQAFEEQYGLRLFDRGNGPVTMTPAGKLAVEHAHRLLTVAGEFDRDMRLFGKGGAGRTGVGMGPLMASLLLPRLGTFLMRENPQLTFVTQVGAPDQMLDALLDGTIELIVGNSWQVGLIPGVEEEPLGALPLAVVVNARHPLASAGQMTMRDLDAFPAAVAFDYATGSQSNSAGAFVCENFSIHREIVMQTDCTWLVSPAFIKSELEQGILIRLDVADLPASQTQTNLVFLRGRTRSPASLLIAEMVRSIIQESGQSDRKAAEYDVTP